MNEAVVAAAAACARKATLAKLKAAQPPKRETRHIIVVDDEEDRVQKKRRVISNGTAAKGEAVSGKSKGKGSGTKMAGLSAAAAAAEDKILEISDYNEEEEDAGDEKFEVKSIVDVRERQGVKEYKVRWKNYGSEDDTWEEASSLESAALAVADYERKRQARPDMAALTSRSRPRIERSGDRVGEGPGVDANAPFGGRTELSMLILGDGNLSFSLSITRMMGRRQSADRLPPHWSVLRNVVRLRATSVLPKEKLFSVYGGASAYYKAIVEQEGASVHFETDATALDPRVVPPASVDLCVFNFPLVGHDHVGDNQKGSSQVYACVEFMRITAQMSGVVASLLWPHPLLLPEPLAREPRPAARRVQIHGSRSEARRPVQAVAVRPVWCFLFVEFLTFQRSSV